MINQEPGQTAGTSRRLPVHGRLVMTRHISHICILGCIMKIRDPDLFSSVGN